MTAAGATNLRENELEERIRLNSHNEGRMTEIEMERKH